MNQSPKFSDLLLPLTKLNDLGWNFHWKYNDDGTVHCIAHGRGVTNVIGWRFDHTRAGKILALENVIERLSESEIHNIVRQPDR